MFRISLGEFFRDTYLKFKESPVYGFYSFNKPTLVINDPDLIRLILTKNFASFRDRGMYSNEQIDPMSGHLFLLPGARWKYLRNKLTPAFTSSKVKQMFFAVKECSDTLVSCVAETAEKTGLVGVTDLMARFSTDVIASTAFGIQCNSLENPDEEFFKWGQKSFEPRVLINTVFTMAPRLLELLNIPPTDKHVSKFFIDAFNSTVAHRTANKLVGKDFLGLLMQLMNKGCIQHDDPIESEHMAETNSERITMLEGAAQAFIFWIAGSETSAMTASYCLYELALHQDIQDKVVDEINAVLKDSGDVTYESLNEMHYLHKAASETMRKYPPLPMLNRECNEDFDLPGVGFRVPKGTPIVIPIYGLHSDPEIFPDPEKFDPERFNQENISSRHQYTYLPFGDGPRNCIGARFGLTQVKVALVSLLSKFRFKPGPDLARSIEMKKGSLVLSPREEITLQIERR